MNIMVLNSSGNVGKSTISRELLYPRFEDAKIVEVETVNKGSKELGHLRVSQFKSGDDFAELYMMLLEPGDLIVDVGASNIAPFWEQMSDFAGVETLFDLFVVPTVAADKEMTDSFKTILFLRAQGISDEKIKVVFNRVKTSVENEFAVLLAADFDFDTSLFLRDSALFTELGFLRKTIFDIYDPDLDFYKSKILSEPDPQKKIVLLKSDLANRMAVKIKEDMDDLFEALTGQAPDLSLFSPAIEDQGEVLPKAKKEKPAAAPAPEPEAVPGGDDEEL